MIVILRFKNRAKVKGINIVKKHEKTTKEKKGGIICFDGSFHGRTVGAQIMTGSEPARAWIGYQHPEIHHLPFPYPWKIKNIDPKIMSTEINFLQKMGVDIIKKKSSLIVSCSKKLKKVDIITEPYPGFPTDLQAQIMVLMINAEGVSKIKENIFENRFMHISELKRMGAHIETKGNKATIFGKKKLSGAESVSYTHLTLPTNREV